MKSTLHEKLTHSVPYEKEELHWLLDHIGDPDPTIRDNLVYASFCHGLLDELISLSDFRELAQTILRKNLLFYRITETGQPTLTRSFTALLATLLIGLDGNNQSIYFNSLSEAQRNQFFQQALDYLGAETDSTGLSPEYGWVHAFAHGSDFLLYASQHENFPTSFKTIWETICSVFKQQTSIFSANEEKRLATVVVQLLCNKKINSTELALWIAKTDFPSQEDTDYLSFINYQNFLSTIYLHTHGAGLLSSELKEAIQQVCRE